MSMATGRGWRRAVLVALLAAGCGDDGGPVDSGIDAALGDAALQDAGSRDGGPPADGSIAPDGGVSDSGIADASTDATFDGGEDGGMAAECYRSDAPAMGGRWEDSTGVATLDVAERESCYRTYTLETTADLRDGRPDNPRVFSEGEGAPTVRSGNDLFDALYALSQEELRQLSVDMLSDGAFDDGAGLPCPAGGCFETGRLWNYVWTRDSAYAVDLGIGAMDPVRATNTLLFKLSQRRVGAEEQIVQDTGSGGSYPVSTDRVSWALGAAALLPNLEGAARTAFVARAYGALAATLEHDRQAVFDDGDGLYRGESSFLDWREQTYPDWMGDDVVHIAMGKSLSTNVLHYRALRLASELATETGAALEATRYGDWADALLTSIRSTFWLEEEGQFSAFTTTGLDEAPVRRFDLLGNALAILHGVATPAQAERIVASYPHYGPGAPVIWPQQQQTRIYHNRGEWPFVTAYWVRAAREAGNVAVMERGIRALIRGAALNLSNMENFEAATGLAFKGDEGEASGPVVNSQRQLWSVAGYQSMVHQSIFGLRHNGDELAVQPYLPDALRDALFSGQDELALSNFPWRDHRLTVVLHYPGAGEGEVLIADEVRLDGVVHAGPIAAADLDGHHRVDVQLRRTSASEAITEVDASDWQNVYGPRTPSLAGPHFEALRLELTLGAHGPERSDTTWRIYRDGAVVADDLPGTTTRWRDEDFDPSSGRSVCYSAELTFAGSGNHSQHSSPVCYWGRMSERVSTIGVDAITASGGVRSEEHGRPHWGSWGDEGDTLTASFTATSEGSHLFQVTFGNGGPISTGVSCGHKWLRIVDPRDESEVAAGLLVMPHLGDWSRWEDSNFVSAELEAGQSYRIEIFGDEGSINMSALRHFERYTGGVGGRDGVFERVNIAEIKVLQGR